MRMLDAMHMRLLCTTCKQDEQECVFVRIWQLGFGAAQQCAVVHVSVRVSQGKQILQDGIGRATEIEEELVAKDARKFLQQPSELLKLPSELMRNLAR
jgi:hypothetical protein